MNDDQISEYFAQALFADIRDAPKFWQTKPLLAHYTSIPVLEAILRNDEVWFSNPLIMNDMQEVSFGINLGLRQFLASNDINDACTTVQRSQILKEHFASCYNKFATDHVMDTYVFCLSEHQKANTDGVLSMWRVFGGNGNGAAIVFDTSKFNVLEQSPLIVAKVNYASPEKQIEWINQRIAQFAELLTAEQVPDEKLHIRASWFFERLKLFAIFTKHCGFIEANGACLYEE